MRWLRLRSSRASTLRFNGLVLGICSHWHSGPIQRDFDARSYKHQMSNPAVCKVNSLLTLKTSVGRCPFNGSGLQMNPAKEEAWEAATMQD